MSRCTNYDFAYLAADHGLLFALLFSRQRLAEASLGEFQQLLKSTEGIQIARWAFSMGAIPTEPRLFYKGYVLTGTLSGMIDPFLLHGISGALTSGKIAAQALLDRQGAIREFRHLTRNFHLKKALKALSVRLPSKSVTLPLMMWMDNHLCGVGFVK
jgi:flavin-dependent dehydrogenase